MKTLQSSRVLAQRLSIAGAAGVVLTLAGCSLWDEPSASLPGAQTPAPFAPAPVPAGFYRVNPGDTLATVAGAFGRNLDEIAAWNRLPADYPVNVGQLLRVAPWPNQAAFAPSVQNPVQAGAAAGTPQPPAAQQPRFVWPVSGPVRSSFGTGDSKSIRLGSTPNEAVRAAEGGRVIYAGSQLKAYGQIVIIKHDGRFVSAYGNNAKILVKEGDTVRQGQPIAQMGADGDAGRTLIFELRDGGKAVDPQSYLPKRAG
jgi:lipoprotein NlpD